MFIVGRDDRLNGAMVDIGCDDCVQKEAASVDGCCVLDGVTVERGCDDLPIGLFVLIDGKDKEGEIARSISSVDCNTILGGGGVRGVLKRGRCTVGIAFSKARANSCTLAKRSCESFARAFNTTFSRAGGMSGSLWCSEGGGVRRCWLAISANVP